VELSVACLDELQSPSVGHTPARRAHDGTNKVSSTFVKEN
jgi:hypothetical protein